MNAALCSTRDPSDRSTLSWLATEFARDEARENPDVIVELSKLRVTASDTVEVPGLPGEYEMGDWPRRQLARLLGVSWDRWFAGVSADERAAEVNRRLSRAEGHVRVRTIKKVDGDGLVADGAVRAFVSPSYTAIPDTAVAHALRDALAEVEPNARLVRADITHLTASYVVMLGAPFHAGDGGEVGEVWGGLAIRNSGVGFSKLAISLHLTRVACLNGLVAPMPDASIVRSVHRGVDVAKVREKIVAGLDGVTDRLHRGARVLEDATRLHVQDAEREVRDLLRGARLPLGLASDVMVAYAKEPNQSKFGISQALTLAAQRAAPETRWALEALTGAYLARGA